MSLISCLLNSEVMFEYLRPRHLPVCYFNSTLQQMINHYLSSICPAPQKMILTINTCMAAVYMFSFFLGPSLFNANTIGIWLAIYATSRYHFLEPQTLAPSACLQANQSSSSSRIFLPMYMNGATPSFQKK